MKLFSDLLRAAQNLRRFGAIVSYRLVRRVARHSNPGHLHHSDRGKPLRSRPSVALSATTLLMVGASIALPFTPLGAILGFTVFPASYLPFLAGVAGTYLLLVECAKLRLMRRFMA